MKRKILSAVMALAMVIALLPAALAADDPGTCSVEISVANGTGSQVNLTIKLKDSFSAGDDISYAVYTDTAWNNVGNNWTGFGDDNTVLGEAQLNGTDEDTAAGKTITKDISGIVAGQTGKLHILCYDATGGASASARLEREFENGRLAVAKCEITWDLNYTGAPAATKGNQNQGEKVTLPANPSRTGWKFNGWFDAATGGNAITAASNVPAAASATYYAQWTEKAEPTVPTVAAVTYKFGLAMSDLTLPKTDGNKVTWTWDASQTPTVGTKNYKASAVETDDYKAATAKDVSVTVNKGTVTVGNTSGYSVKTGTQLSSVNINDLGITVKDTNATNHNVKATLAWKDGTATITEGGKTAAFTVTITDEAGNYETVAEQTYTFNVTAKAPQNITAADMTAVYGDTGKKVTASTSGDGALSYAIKDGGDVIDVDPATGALTIKKVGTAHVTVTAAETTQHSEATKDVTVTVSPKQVSVVAPTLKEGEAFPTTGTVTGGVDGEDVSVTLTWADKDGNPPVGTVEKNVQYTWTAALAGANAGNYELKANTGNVKLGGGGGFAPVASSYTVNYTTNAHGSLTGSTSEKVEKGKTPASVPTPAADKGYAFVGWSMDGGKTFVNPAAQTISANTTFTAMFGHKAYVQGRPGDVFVPNGNITRAEAVRMMCNLEDDYNVNGSYASAYTDVLATDWFASAVGYGSQHNFVTGYPDGSYKPTGNITRGEFAALVARYMGVAEEQGSTGMSDVAGHWAEGYIVAMVNRHLIDGYNDGTFRPDQYITRAEAVRLMNGALGRRVAEGKDFAKYTNPYHDVNSSDWFYKDVLEATLVHVIEDLH